MQYKAYYQWVPFVLFLQACVFYTPHALFKLAEGGKVASIISGLHHKGDTLIFIKLKVKRFTHFSNEHSQVIVIVL